MPLFAALLLVLTPGMGAADPAPASPVPEVSTATPSVVQEALQAVVGSLNSLRMAATSAL